MEKRKGRDDGFDKGAPKEKEERNNDLIIGRNAVSEALRSDRAIDTLLVLKGERNGSVGRILAECREKGIVIKEVDKKKLDFLCGQGNHQGVAAWAAVHEYSTVEDMLNLVCLIFQTKYNLHC